MRLWLVLLLVWIAPALVLLVALIRANLRKAVHGHADDRALPGDAKRQPRASID